MTTRPAAPESPPAATPAKVPVWRRLVAAVAGLALVAAAVYVRSLTLTPDQLDDPITASGGMSQEVDTDLFSARLERVEFARSVLVKKEFGTDRATPGQVFLVAKVGATAPRRPIQLHSHLLTADGLRFAASDRVPDTATLAWRWIQPGWWRSGYYFFDVPADKVAGARVVVSKQEHTLYGDQFYAEAAFDMGLDAAGARRLVGAAKDVFEVSG
ncbi:hypothetical protein [Sphaerisporangium sp. TRM90804]|uniref:hypothetical protein n=1 Tax=Sphaerisporangium sp. TRM90804 TaxID=3031113 RepID=UPI00244C7249|nr:hypothetical protein [Sphaerisporangium sp. TRM90804]MDH2426959.1 hypothetical protein [Sphaerisporangium sp. TRM90804]